MTAYLIRADGTVADTLPMEIKGTIKREEDISRLKLDIEVPKNFRYMFQSEDDGDLCINSNAQQPGDFILSGYDYDRVKNTPAMSNWGINTEKEYFISCWGKEFGQYLVGATDPDVTPEDIVEHFGMFVEKNPIE